MKKPKFEGQTEIAKKSDSDIEGDTKTRKTDVEDAKEAETLPIAKTEKKSGEQVLMS